MSTKVVNAVREREAAKRRAAIVELAQPKKVKKAKAAEPKAKRPKKEQPVEVVAAPEPDVEPEAVEVEPAEPEGPDVIEAYDDRTVTEADAVDVSIENADDPVEETVTE